MEIVFEAVVWYWRGPSPFYFVSVPAEQAAQLRAVSSLVTYGWGMVPVQARIGATCWKTSLFPKDGGYVLPLKDAVRRAEEIGEGDWAQVSLLVSL